MSSFFGVFKIVFGNGIVSEVMFYKGNVFYI